MSEECLRNHRTEPRTRRGKLRRAVVSLRRLLAVFALLFMPTIGGGVAHASAPNIDESVVPEQILLPSGERWAPRATRQLSDGSCASEVVCMGPISCYCSSGGHLVVSISSDYDNGVEQCDYTTTTIQHLTRSGAVDAVIEAVYGPACVVARTTLKIPSLPFQPNDQRANPRFRELAYRSDRGQGCFCDNMGCLGCVGNSGGAPTGAVDGGDSHQLRGSGEPGTTASRIRALELVGQATSKIDRGEFRGAIDDLEQAKGLDLSMIETRAWLAIAYLREGRVADSRTEFQAVVRGGDSRLVADVEAVLAEFPAGDAPSRAPNRGRSGDEGRRDDSGRNQREYQTPRERRMNR